MNENNNRAPQNDAVTTSLHSEYILVEGPYDTTVRPRRPGIARFWPEDVPFPPPPEYFQKPSTNGEDE